VFDIVYHRQGWIFVVLLHNREPNRRLVYSEQRTYSNDLILSQLVFLVFLKKSYLSTGDEYTK